MDFLNSGPAQGALKFWAEVQALLLSLLVPYRLWQVALVIGLMVVAALINRAIGPRIEAWLRRLEGLPIWQMRFLATARRRVFGLIYVVLLWIAVLAIAQMSPFPSRRYLVELAGTIAAAWVLIGILVSVIRNRSLRRLVRWGGWLFATLYFLGFVEPATEFLDSAAVSFGTFRLSILAVLKALVVTGFLFTGARMVAGTITSRIARNEDISPSMRVLAGKFLQITLYGAAIFIGLKAVGFDLTGLAVLSGAVGVGLGFGLQKVVSNLVSGVIILLDKSIKPGDVISLGETFGWIESLGARYVSVVTRDGKEYLIPNEDLITGQVVNWSHSNEYVRLDLFFGASYDADPHLVRKLAVEAAGAVNRVLNDHPAVCHIVGFGDSSVDYILRFWIRDPTEGLTNIRGNVYLALWDAFKANGISIPFPQREVRIMGDAPLSKGTDAL